MHKAAALIVCLATSTTFLACGSDDSQGGGSGAASSGGAGAAGTGGSSGSAAGGGGAPGGAGGVGGGSGGSSGTGATAGSGGTAGGGGIAGSGGTGGQFYAIQLAYMAPATDSPAAKVDLCITRDGTTTRLYPGAGSNGTGGGIERYTVGAFIEQPALKQFTTQTSMAIVDADDECATSTPVLTFSFPINAENGVMRDGIAFLRSVGQSIHTARTNGNKGDYTQDYVHLELAAAANAYFNDGSTDLSLFPGPTQIAAGASGTLRAVSSASTYGSRPYKAAPGSATVFVWDTGLTVCDNFGPPSGNLANCGLSVRAP